MACRNTYMAHRIVSETEITQSSVTVPTVSNNVDRLLFGVDSKTQANDLLQNNIDEFEWIVRNKIYPHFYGRYLTGNSGLTKEEIKFLHSKGCKIAALYAENCTKQTSDKGRRIAEKICRRTVELGIPAGTAIFLEIKDNENITTDFLKGFASYLIIEGFTPAFKANTDAKFTFDREFSRGMQMNKDIFKRCLIWATSPTIKEYDGITTTHLIHPDNWTPFAPSAITRAEIAIWQYGKDCHPIKDDNGNPTTFNLNLVRNEQVIIEKMF